MNPQFCVWDWNGTLLDDVQVCVDTMNAMLEKRGLPLLDTARYREIFTFPVQEYYRAAGFVAQNERRLDYIIADCAGFVVVHVAAADADILQLYQDFVRFGRGDWTLGAAHFADAFHYCYFHAAIHCCYLHKITFIKCLVNYI